MIEDDKLNILIDARIQKVVPILLKSTAFSQRKVTDTPTDNLDVVNRKYVTNNGAVANRPNSSVATIGQPYLATDIGIPMIFTAGGWVNGVGSIVAGL